MTPSSFGPGPIDPQGAFSPPPPPSGGMPPNLPSNAPAGSQQGYHGQPMFMMAPPPENPPAKGKTFARAIFLTLASTIFGISLLLNIYLIMISGLLHAKDMQRETVIEKGDELNKIVVLSVDGVINEKLAQTFRKQLKSLEDDVAVKALVIEVDSPGGSVTASDEIYHDLMNYKAKSGKPVVVSQGSLAASGGYYVSCAGDFIIAQPTTLTGNIGVLLQRFNVSKLLDKWGIEETTLKSEKSPFKNVESMFKPETPEANAYLKTIVDEAYVQFSTVVSTGRSGRLKGKIEDIANGKVYTANQAFKLGLVDKIDYPESAYAEAITRANLGGTKPTIVRLKESGGLLDLLNSRSGVSDPSAGLVGGKVELNAVKIDAGSVYEMLLPKVMYLWDGH